MSRERRESQKMTVITGRLIRLIAERVLSEIELLI